MTTLKIVYSVIIVLVTIIDFIYSLKRFKQEMVVIDNKIKVHSKQQFFSKTSQGRAETEIKLEYVKIKMIRVLAFVKLILYSLVLFYIVW